MNVFELSAVLRLDSSQYESGLNKAENSTQSFGSKIGSALGTAAKVGSAAITAAATATAAMTTAVIKGTSEVARYGDNIDKMSQKMGLSATAYQEWDAIMQHSGTSIESMQAGMKTLANAVENGNQAFERLGMTQEEIANMSNEELFAATITALQNVENETERTYLAGQLLGRGATELGALLNMSAEETEAMRLRVHELGGVMSDEAVKAAAQYQDSLQDMKTAFGGLGRSLTVEFMPSITKVMDGLTEIFVGNTGAGIQMISQGITQILSKIHTELPKFLTAGLQIIKAIGQAIINNLPTIVQSGIEIIISLATALLQALPQLIEQVPQIIMAIVNGLRTGFPDIMQVGGEIVQAIGNSIASLASQAWQWGSDMMLNFINGIRSWFGQLVDDLKSIGQTVRNFIGFSEPKMGPLSDFHTFAPDMMELFASGIRDNADLIEDAFNDSVDLGMPTVNTTSGHLGAFSGGSAGGGKYPDTVVIQVVLDKKVIGETSYSFSKQMARVMG